MLGVPHSVEREVLEWEICVGDRLPCQFPTVAIFIAHDGSTLLNFNADHDEPIRL